MLKSIASALVSALLLGASPAARAAEADGSSMKLADLPAAVQTAIREQGGSAAPGGIFKSVENGETNYEVELTVNDKTRSYSISEEGELLAVQAFLEELPGPVQKAIQAQVGQGTLGDIAKVTEDGEVTYEVEMTQAGRARHFSIAANGELLQRQVFLEETPAAVQRAIGKELQGGKCGEIYQSVEDGAAEFEAEITTSGKSRNVSFDPHGTVVYEEEPVAVSDTPTAVQKTL